MTRKEKRDYIRQSMNAAQQFAAKWGNKHGTGYKTADEAVMVIRDLEKALKMLDDIGEV